MAGKRRKQKLEETYQVRHLTLILPKNLYQRSLNTSRYRFEALAQNKTADTDTDPLTITEDPSVTENPSVAVETNNVTQIKPPPPIFMKRVLDFPNFC